MHRCLWLVLLLLAVLPVQAASDWDLKVGSYFGKPVPVGVPGVYAEILNNTARTARGRVEVYSGETRVAWAELELPPATRRRTELRMNGSAARGGTDRLEVRLLVGDAVVAREHIESAWFNTPTLVLSPRESLVQLLNAYQTHNNQAGTTRAVELAPESPRPYQGAALIVLHDAAGLALSDVQMIALAAYVREGGDLLFIANQDPAEYRGTPLESLFPLSPEGVRELSGGYTVLTGTVSPNDNVLVKREGVPLMISGNRGLGRVHLITAEMVSPQLLGEKSTFALIDRLAVAGNDYSRWQPQELWGISHEDRLKFSSIALGLGLYFVAAGPLNFFFLRQRHRRVWALVTLPVLAVLFSGLVLLYTAHTRGFQPRLQQYGLLRLESGQKLGLYESTVFLDSLWEGKFTLECSPEADLNGGNYYPWDGTEVDATEMGLSDGRLQLRNLSLNAWSGTALSLSESETLRGPIELDVTWSSSQVVGTLRNRSGLTLQDCQLFYNGKKTRLFPLPPGDTPVKLELLPEASETGDGTRDILRGSVALGGKAIYLTGFLPHSLDPLTASSIQRRTDLTLVAVRRRL